MQYGGIVRLVNEILGEYDFPLTLRQVYYRLVAKAVIPNKRSSYNGLSRILVTAREKGEVDDTRIEDRARGVLEAPRGFESPKGYIDAARSWFKSLGDWYNADMWANQDGYLEIWVEKDALSRVVSRAVEPYRVTVCPSRGYSSYTYIKREAVDHRFAFIPDDKPIFILDFRDHDPSGLHMTEDLETRFNKYSSRQVTVTREALTIEQVRKYKLTPNPTKSADTRTPRYREQFGDKCWELDAIEPKELQEIVKKTVESHINKDIWDDDLYEETRDREKLKRRFKRAKIKL